MFGACVTTLSCARAPAAFSVAKLKNPDRHPNATAAFDRCKKALSELAPQETDARFAKALEGCRDLYLEPGCREALTPSDAPLDRRPLVIAAACARAYCDLLPQPTPWACNVEVEGLEPLERNRRLADLHLAILTFDLGVSPAMKILTPLSEVQDSRSHEGLLFTVDMAPNAGQAKGPSGGLDKHVLYPIVAALNADVRACYEQRLQFDHQLALGLITRFIINSEGLVQRAFVVAATRREPALEQCITDLQAGLTFPPPRGGGTVWVTFPYVLLFREEAEAP